MKKLFDELSTEEIDHLVHEATKGAILDTLARGLPVSGMVDGVVVTKSYKDPISEDPLTQIKDRK